MSETIILNLLAKLKQYNTNEIINFDKYNKISFSYHSTAIEGSSLTADEVTLLLIDGLTAKGKPLIDHLMVKDHHNALKITLELAETSAPVTPEIIQHISSLVMKSTGGPVNTPLGAYDSSKGQFRKSMVRVGARLFMDPGKVPLAVDHLCQEIQAGLASVANVLDVYDLAFEAHFKLVDIHPFADGNGRVARLLMNLILHRHGLPLGMLAKEDRPDYLKILSEANESGDASAFRRFMLERQVKHLADQIAMIERSLQRPEGQP
jgi:Fic family protein